MNLAETKHVGFSEGRTMPRRESQRRFVVRAVLFIFFLSLVEGPLRKWLLPDLAGPLTLLRDPFVIALYAYCLANGLMLTRGIAQIWLGFAILTSLFGLWQYVSDGLALSGWMLGVRTYWLYMPLAFVIAKTFQPEDVARFLRIALWISIPYALLVAAQYKAPPYAYVNLGIAGDESSAVGLANGIVRPFGLFTYTGPNVQFTAAMIACFLAFYLSGAPMRRWTLFLLATGLAVGSMSVLTGSRAIYFIAAMIIGITVLGMMIMRPSGRALRRVVGVTGFVILAGILFVEVFPDMLAAMEVRFGRAARSEGSIWGRALEVLTAWVDPLFTAPLTGHGIGAGAPGVARYLGLPPLLYGESDLQRNINELGPVFGLAFLLLRWGTTLWVLFMALGVARRGETMALPLAGFMAQGLALGQITHSPINAFLPWMFLGLVLSMARKRG